MTITSTCVCKDLCGTRDQTGRGSPLPRLSHRRRPLRWRRACRIAVLHQITLLTHLRHSPSCACGAAPTSPQTSMLASAEIFVRRWSGTAAAKRLILAGRQKPTMGPA